ncbi:MAG: hypothetical protein RBU23_05350 [Candidatus Auribacterota bacterium]|nr:hypothetical protein [Candidatus Auribacterota bacterium]
MRFFKHCCVVFFIFLSVAKCVSFAEEYASPEINDENIAEVSEPDNGDLQQSVQSGSIQERHRVYTKRLNYYEEQIEADNADIELILEAANLASFMAKHDKSIKFYRKAIRELHESDGYPLEKIRETYKILINLYLREQKSDMAIATFKQMCDNEPDNIDLNLEFAQFLRDNGFPRRAFLEYRKLLSMQPGNLKIIDMIMQLHAQGHISKQELESVISQEDKQ